MSKSYLRIRAVVLALCLFGVGVLIYQDLAEAERTGVPKSMNVVLVVAYDLAGKRGVMVAWALVSAVFVWLSLRWTSGEDRP